MSLRSLVTSAWAAFAILATTSLLIAQGLDDPGQNPLLGLSIKELSELTVDSVFAASKFSQKLTEAPSSVSIVTRNDIRQFGYRTLADVVKSVPGYDVTYDRSYNYTGVRGFNSLGDYGSRVLLLVDGHRTNEALYDSAQLGTDALLDVDLIERVEIIRGPGSAVYGSNAFSGVINVITRRGRDINGVEVSSSAGSFGTYAERLTIGQQLASGFEYLISASKYDSDGPSRLFYKEFASSLTNHGIAINQDSDQFWSMFTKMSIGDFTLQGGYVTRDKDVPTASYDSWFNTPHPLTDSRGYAELLYGHQFDNGWSASGKLFYDSYEYYEINRQKDATLVDSSQARWWGLELSANRTFWEKLRISAGMETRTSLDLHQNEHEQKSFRETLQICSEQQVIGAYLEGEWKIADSLSLSGGFRWDHYNSFGDAGTPRSAVIWHPDEKTTLKLLYGEAFRAPNPYQLNYAASGFVANPALHPEKMNSVEVVAERALDKHWTASLSAYDNDIKDLIDVVILPGGLSRFENVNRAEVEGLEAQLSGKWDNGVQLKTSYSRQSAMDGDTNEWLVNSPKDMIKTEISTPIWSNKLSAGLELLYVSRRATLAGNRTPDAWLLNLTLLSRELAPGLDVSVSVYNLLGSDISVPGGTEHSQDSILQDGRTFRVKLNYRF
jgi:outer membrane receptor for ferrienterochelin and colicins